MPVNAEDFAFHRNFDSGETGQYGNSINGA